MRRLGRPFLLAAAAGAALLLMLAFAAMRWASSHAASTAEVAADQMARSQAGLLASELQKFRLLPLVLTEYPDVTAVLQGADPAATGRLNGKLELLSRRTDAAAIYV